MCAEVCALVDNASAEILSLLPPAIGEHLTAARREVLTAVKCAVEAEIDRGDRLWEVAKDRRNAASGSGEQTEEA